jgi:hypothetical protein
VVGARFREPDPEISGFHSFCGEELGKRRDHRNILVGKRWCQGRLGMVTTCEFSHILRLLQSHGAVMNIKAENGCDSNLAEVVHTKDMDVKMSSMVLVGPAARKQATGQGTTHLLFSHLLLSYLTRVPAQVHASAADRLSKLHSLALPSECYPLSSPPV